MSKYDATIAIPSFNGYEYIGDVLEAIFRQKTDYSFEVLVIDSGSDQRTLDIIKNFPKVHLHQIPNSEFGHGKTRNLAAKMADSDFILYLSDDAVPAHEQWLNYMLEPFRIDEKISCVFGKQIPRKHCFATLKREVIQVFSSFGDDGSISIQRKTQDTEALGITNNFFSDVNSALRKSTWEKVKYQDVNYAEDQLMGIDMLKAGYHKAYSPLGAVEHSHDLSLKNYYKRKFDEYVGLRKSTGYTAQAGRKELFIGSAKSSLQDIKFTLKDKDFTPGEKLHDIILIPFYNIRLRQAIRKAARSLSDEEIQKNSLEFEDRSKATQ